MREVDLRVANKARFNACRRTSSIVINRSAWFGFKRNATKCTIPNSVQLKDYNYSVKAG